MSDRKDTERGRRLFHQPAEVEGQGIKGKFEPEQDVEGHAGYRWGSDSEAPENTDLSDADAAEESEVEGQAVRGRGPAAEVEGQLYKVGREPTADVEGQAMKGKRDDSATPESTDVKDATDDSDVEGQA